MDYQDDYTQAEEYQAPEVEEVTRYSPAWIKFFLEDFNFLRRPNVTDENAGKAIKALLRFWETLEPLTPEEEGPDGLIAMMIDTPLARIKKGSSALYRQCLINALNAYGVKAGSKTPTRDLERMVSEARAEAERQREAAEREKAEAAEAEKEAAKAKKEAAKKKRQAEREAAERARQLEEQRQEEQRQKEEKAARERELTNAQETINGFYDLRQRVRTITDYQVEPEIEAWINALEDQAEEKAAAQKHLAKIYEAAKDMPEWMPISKTATAEQIISCAAQYRIFISTHAHDINQAYMYFYRNSKAGNIKADFD